MKVVQNRVDALTLAFRVELRADFVRLLEERQRVAREHGRASCVWEVDGASLDLGELRFSRVARVWNITKEPVFRLRIDLGAPGAVVDPHDESKREPGWTLEVVWYAQTLARRALRDVLSDSLTIVRALGTIYETRLRRIDMCADIDGLDVASIEPANIIKRSRTTDADWENQTWATRKLEDEPIPSSVYRVRKVNGIVIGRNAIACRIYDKPAELQRETRHAHGDDACACRRCNEEKRWHAGGWDGVSPVTRIEYQLRGVALKEFGCRNPDACVELRKNDRTGKLELGRIMALPDYVDALWHALLDWARVAEPSANENTARTRWEDTEAWALLRRVRFSDAKDARPAGRTRIRGAASGAQALGAALSYAAQRGVLERVDEKPESYEGGGYAAEWSRLSRMVRVLLGESVADSVARELAARWGTTSSACAHLAVRWNAAISRFEADELSLFENLKQVELKGALSNECRIQQRPDDRLSPRQWELREERGRRKIHDDENRGYGPSLAR